ncbi:NRDE family protein [Pleionea sp. CnH1-48]|uniref:NRDE family protein n=1 Tax=Pleionea sp. CnH1-48 TaxID=2954494 RepID=UPI002096C182|nr:NRDE family protein [Pleionea sp. CnH1-48]MCO7225143.1 NRDE family protein [Pleionea sp. CnH1-48]
MCLISLAIEQHPQYPFILVANRDEFFQRPTAPLHFWEDNPDILAGRDMEAGGTWLGIHRSGRWAAVTNYRDPTQPIGELSRGALVVDYLTSHQSANEWCHTLRDRAAKYSGFNLIVGHFLTKEICYFSNRENQIREIPTGMMTFSNGQLEDQWPKMRRLQETFKQQLTLDNLSDTKTLISLLHNTAHAEQHELPQTGIPLDLEQQLSSLFIKPFKTPKNIMYGTRSSAMVALNRNGQVSFIEQTFDENGQLALETHHALEV